MPSELGEAANFAFSSASLVALSRAIDANSQKLGSTVPGRHVAARLCQLAQVSQLYGSSRTGKVAPVGFEGFIMLR